MASFDVDVTVSDISISSTSKPMQPRLSFYPNKYISGRSRSFLLTWYDKYSWLEYRISRNVAFCFCCPILEAQQTLGPKQDLTTRKTALQVMEKLLDTKLLLLEGKTS